MHDVDREERPAINLTRGSRLVCVSNVHGLRLPLAGGSLWFCGVVRGNAG